MRRVFVIVALVAGLLVTGCSWFSFRDGEPEKVIIVFEEDSYADELRQIIEEGISVYAEIEIIPAVACYLTPNQQRWVKKVFPIKYIEPDYEVSLLDLPMSIDVGIKETPAEELLDWGLERINAEPVWADATGRGVRVGIIDTGIAPDHPDLYNADGSYAVVGGYSAFGDSWHDQNNHGTYIATILAARHNDVGIMGVAPDAVLYAAKVLDADGRGSASTVLLGYQWCLEQEIQVVNLSLGCFYLSRAMEAAMIVAAWQGMGTIAAAGNDGHGLIYPAKYPTAVCVGATGLNDEKMSWSNYGPALQANGVVAPGNWILAGNKEGGWQRVAGTSASTPYVTGLVALLLDRVRGGWCERRFIFGGASGANNPTEATGYGLIDCAATFQLMLNDTANGHGLTWGSESLMWRRGEL